MIRRENDSITIYCERCHRETKIKIDPEENRDYCYCGYCGDLIRDEIIIRKKFNESMKTVKLVDIGEEYNTYSVD